MTEQAAHNDDYGCPECGGEHLAAFGRHVWCNECDWIDPARVDTTWADGDYITQLSTGTTWTRSEGQWWCDLGGKPKTDEHATKTLEYFGNLVSVVKITRTAVDS
jgi:hypothetical protein